MVQKVFDKKSTGSGIKSKNMLNQELAEELRKQCLQYLLENLKNEKLIHILKTILDESKCKPNKIWLDKGSEFYNESMKLQLQEKSIKMHSTDNEEKSVAAKIFARIFKE